MAQVWPDLSMLSYQKAAPLLRAICAKHGVPYVQENVFLRLMKACDGRSKLCAPSPDAVLPRRPVMFLIAGRAVVLPLRSSKVHSSDGVS